MVDPQLVAVTIGGVLFAAFVWASWHMGPVQVGLVLFYLYIFASLANQLGRMMAGNTTTDHLLAVTAQRLVFGVAAVLTAWALQWHYKRRLMD